MTLEEDLRPKKKIKMKLHYYRHSFLNLIAKQIPFKWGKTFHNTTGKATSGHSNVKGNYKVLQVSNSYLKLSTEYYYQLAAMTAIIFSYNLQSSTSVVALNYLSSSTGFLSALPLNLLPFPLFEGQLAKMKTAH